MAEIKKDAITKKIDDKTYVLVWVNSDGFYGAAQDEEGSIDTDDWHYEKSRRNPKRVLILSELGKENAYVFFREIVKAVLDLQSDEAADAAIKAITLTGGK